jgi:dihydrofolate reductase
MRKLIMWNVVTVDGYFEGENKWDLSFHNAIWGPELEKLSHEQLEAADYLIFGRVTYEGMAAYWKNADNENATTAKLMNSIPKLVFSKTLKKDDPIVTGWNNTTLINGNASTEISRLKSQDGKDMYVFGSADLCTTLINDDLIDEYRLGVAPVILGRGTPLFKQGVTSRKLSVVSTQQLSSGGALLKLAKKL